MATNEETDQSSTLSHCGKDTAVQEKEKDLQCVLFSGSRKKDRNRNAPTCDDLHQQWTQLCEEPRIAACRLLKHVYKICGTYQDNNDTLFKTKTATGAISRRGISHEKIDFKVDSGASMHMMSKNDLNHEKPFRIRKKLVRLLQRTDQLDIFITVQCLEYSPAVFSKEKLCEERVYSYDWKGRTITHIYSKWQNDQLHVGTLCTTNPRCDADAVLGDRMPTASGDLQPFTEGLVDGESGSGSAGETPTPPPHVPARPSNTSGGTHQALTIQLKNHQFAGGWRRNL